MSRRLFRLGRQSDRGSAPDGRTILQLLSITRELLDQPARRRVALSFVGSVVLGLLDAFALALVLPFVQAISNPGSVVDIPVVGGLFDFGSSPGRGSLVAVGGLILGLFVVRSVLSIAFVRWQLAFLSYSEGRMASGLLRRYIDAPYALHLERNSAELVRNVQISVPIFFAAIVMGFLTMSTDIIVMLAISSALILQEPMITLLAAGMASIVGVTYQRWANPRSRRIGVDTNRFAKECQQFLQQALDGVKEVKALGREREFVDVYRRSRMGWADVRRQQSFLQFLPRYYLETAMMLIIMVISLVLLSSRTGENALGVLALFAAAGFRMAASLNRILQSLSQMKVGTEPALALRADIALLESAADVDDAARLALDSSLVVANVSFRYSETQALVLDDVSLEVRKGEFVGIVGRSGSGKTTFVDILLGLLLPEQGLISVGGVDIFDRLPAWRRAIGYVPQTIYLTDDTLRHNVAFGLVGEAIDDAALLAAVRRAQLDDLIAQLPLGLDTFVGERGVRLSGGQRQRIGIARALYRDPSVLLLDEATSALDAETEARIGETLERLHGDVTIITIAHRLSTVRACDRLIYFDRGRVVATGSFEELERSHVDFARMVELSSLARPESGPVR